MQNSEYNENSAHAHVIPQKSMKKEAPWRGSSGFGLANILNRSTSGGGNNLPLQKFNLPSLHSFGKPLVTKSEHRPMVEESSQLAVHVTENENQTAPTRKIAPAPTDDDENESSSTSIRGGRWTSDEHERFLAGFKIHGHKWKRVQQVVRTRSVTQVRTHAQKYLLKLAKMKAETKQKSSEGDGASSDKQTIKSESGEGFHTSDEPAPEPEEDAMSPNGRVSRKKFKSHHHGDLDEEYIAAAAKTLCLLMRQNIDSILDGKEVAENDKDYEPYEYHRGYANEHHYYEDVAFVEGKKIYSA